MNQSNYNCAYFRKRLDSHANTKKRTYKEAFGYDNDYECVQEPSKEYNKIIFKNGNVLWKDAYTEQIILKSTSST